MGGSVVIFRNQQGSGSIKVWETLVYDIGMRKGEQHMNNFQEEKNYTYTNL